MFHYIQKQIRCTYQHFKHKKQQIHTENNLDDPVKQV